MRRGERGVTIVEVMVSLILVIVGLVGLYAVLAGSIQGGARASRLTQAQQRASSLIEAMQRSSPQALNCLATTAVSSWASCETTCQNTLVDGGTASAQACILTVDSMALLPGPPAGAAGVANQSLDRAGQRYALYWSSSDPLRSTFVRTAGPSNRIFDVQVAVAWNDDGTTSTSQPQHILTMRTGFFR